MTSVVSSMTVADTMTFRTRRGFAAIVAAGALLVPVAAQAAEPSAAEVLFREGRVLLDAKRYDEACPKLAESQRLEPGAGTLLALAMCHEGQGKPATASAEYKRASELGRRNGRNDLAAAAEKRARALEASVPRLVVRLPADEGSTYRVRRDGEPVSAAELDSPLPMDPGEHRIEVSADGKVSRSYVVRITGAGTTEIVVDRLEDVTAPAPAAAPAPALTTRKADARPVLASPIPATDTKTSSGSAQRTTGLLLVGAGVVSLGVGAYFGGQALSESSQARRLCPEPTSCPDAEKASLNQQAKDSFRASVIGLAAGTGAITIGTLVYFLAPNGSESRADAKPPRKTARFIPSAGPLGVSVGLVGTF